MNLSGDLLDELYRLPRDQKLQQLAARYSPVLYFDAREPYLPLAAGVTLFETDGASPSMQRAIQLAPPGRPAAAAALEYAIWWDWDMHHLYELEHVWVYLDQQGQVVRVEASWHGKYNEMEVRLDGEHPCVLSEPGKHAFASQPGPFVERAAETRRVETNFIGGQARVLINEMFQGKIRNRAYDDSLVRSFLTRNVFEPTMEFSKAFRFSPESLVTWQDLRAWIPRRVNAWLEYLDLNLSPEELRALLLVGCNGDPEALNAVMETGLDGVVLPLICSADGQLATGRPGGHDPANLLEDVFRFARSVPFSAVLDLQQEACIESLARFLNEKNVFGWVPVTAADARWLARLKNLAPRTRVIAPVDTPDADPQAAAAACQAVGVHARWGRPTAGWVSRIHESGLFVLAGPAADLAEVHALEQERVDIVWQESKNR